MDHVSDCVNVFIFSSYFFHACFGTIGSKSEDDT